MISFTKEKIVKVHNEKDESEETASECQIMIT